ncbi:MAG: CoA-binding protein [Chloroflexota bacterium]|nr:CoA-binding protein [Chloroflexota bacterium]
MALDLDLLFHPRSVAVIGVSPDPRRFGGNAWVRTMQAQGFKGALYPVDTRTGEFNGLKVYPSIEEVPGSIDLVVSSIPAQFTPQLVRECIAKGVKFIEFFTAGFTETGDDADAMLEKELTQIAKTGDVRFVGPNCMGVYCPSCGISWRSDLPTESGSVAVMAQSGLNGVKIVLSGVNRGVYFSKFVSYGNASDLNEIDFLDYFAADEESSIITAYIEGVRDGRKFLEAIRQAAKTKPAVVLKGGRTGAGTRAVFSHTASLAGSEDIWESSIKQAGAICVYDVDEMIDTVMALQYLTAPRNRNVAVIGSGGGLSVLAADHCEDAGLKVPKFPPEVREEIGKLMPKAGSFPDNPVDSPLLGNLDKFGQIVRILNDHDDIGSMILHFEVDTTLVFQGRETITEITRAVIEMVGECTKPVAVVLLTVGSSGSVQAINEEQAEYARARIPVYPTIARAAQAIHKLIEYHYGN